MAAASDPISVACASDDAYAMPLAVAIRSLLDNLEPPRTVRLFVVDGGLRARSRKRLLESWPRDRVTVEWIQPDVTPLEGVKVSGHIPVASYFRLMLADWLPPSVERVVYLDCDVVVAASLAKLWAIDLAGHALGAAQDLSAPFVSRPNALATWSDLGLPADRKYWNAGVLLLDLGKWRARSITRELLRYLQSNRGRIRWWDQDALNAVLGGDCFELDPRWNVSIHWATKRDPHVAADFDALLREAYICHFASHVKPWHVDCAHPRRDLFFTYLAKTAWADFRPTRRSDDPGLVRRLRRFARRAIGRSVPSAPPVLLGRPLSPAPVGRAARLRAWLASAEFRRREREIARLRKLPRYTIGETDLVGPVVRYSDWGSLVAAYRQIFEAQIYRFVPRRSPARIIDCGANVGLAVLYLKHLLPDCTILAFEPDPAIFEILSWNCAEWRLSGVELCREAVWNRSGEAEFSADGGDSGRLVAAGGPLAGGEDRRVATRRLRDVLDGDSVDLLKLDVEGAEGAVLRDCADRLERVDHVFVEYHSFTGREQELDGVLGTLRTAGFRVHLQPELVSRHPFLETRESGGMDQRLNVFAYR